jgi:hypothetical protein
MADQPTNITPTATGEPAGPYDTDRQAADDCREVYADTDQPHRLHERASGVNGAQLPMTQDFSRVLASTESWP